MRGESHTELGRNAPSGIARVLACAVLLLALPDRASGGGPCERNRTTRAIASMKSWILLRRFRAHYSRPCAISVRACVCGMNYVLPSRTGERREVSRLREHTCHRPPHPLAARGRCRERKSGTDRVKATLPVNGARSATFSPRTAPGLTDVMRQ